MSQRTSLEDALAFQIKAAKLPTPEREYRFHPTRRWRFDFAWPELRYKLAVEVDGGLWVAGRHSRGAGQLADMEKNAAALLLGWRIVRVGAPHVKSGEALEWIEGLLRMEAA